MDNISILPNPFKILEEQIAKKRSLNDKCDNCYDDNCKIKNYNDENKKEGFNNLNKIKTIEGLGKTDREKSAKVLGFAILVSLISVFMYYLIIYVKFNYKNISEQLGETINNKDTFINEYSNIINSLNSNLKNKNLMLLFIFMFASSFAAFDYSLVYDYPIGEFLLLSLPLSLPIGFIMFVLSKLPAIIDFFENTVGYLVPCKNLNLYMESDTFASIINKNPDDVRINFNPLITLFNLENLARKFIEIRQDTKHENNNTDKNNDNKYSSDFFLRYNKDDNKKKLFTHLCECVIKKRIIGNATWLALTPFVTIGILKGINV